MFLLLCCQRDCAHTCLCRHPKLVWLKKNCEGRGKKDCLQSDGFLDRVYCAVVQGVVLAWRGDGAGGENELTEEGMITTFNGAASFKCLFFLVVKTDNLCNFVKLWPSSHFNKDDRCDLTGERVASSVLQPACSILSPNTHLMSNCFSIFCFSFLKKFHSTFWEICCCTYPSTSLC